MSMCSCTVRVTISSTGGKFRLVSNFTELYALTLAARSYALLVSYIWSYTGVWCLRLALDLKKENGHELG